MQHDDTCRIFFQIMHGILTADDYPAAVKFEADLCGIGNLQQFVVWQDATDGAELGDMVVIGETHARSLYLGRNLVELISTPAPVIECERTLNAFLLMHR